MTVMGRRGVRRRSVLAALFGHGDCVSRGIDVDAAQATFQAKSPAPDATGTIDGGQNFYVNYNLGDGPWERLPMAVTYDGPDAEGGTFSGFAQSIDYSVDGRTLYQATNVENLTTTYNDIRVGSIPLDAQQYEAEKAARTSDTSLVTDPDASNGSKVGNINLSTSSVTFTVHATCPSGQWLSSDGQRVTVTCTCSDGSGGGSGEGTPYIYGAFDFSSTPYWVPGSN